MYTEPTYNYPSPPTDSAGYGLLGCAGGILLGLLGGGLLLIVVSLIWAILNPVPTIATNITPDLHLSVSEVALNQLAQNANGTPVQLDLVPGNQVNLSANTTVSAFGVNLPVQMTGRFGIQIITQSTLEVRLIEAKVAGADLPQEVVTNLFSSPLVGINQSLNQTLADGAELLGFPLVLTGLGTTDTELWLEARLNP